MADETKTDTEDYKALYLKEQERYQQTRLDLETLSNRVSFAQVGIDDEDHQEFLSHKFSAAQKANKDLKLADWLKENEALVSKYAASSVDQDKDDATDKMTDTSTDTSQRRPSSDLITPPKRGQAPPNGGTKRTNQGKSADFTFEDFKALETKDDIKKNMSKVLKLLQKSVE